MTSVIESVFELASRLEIRNINELPGAWEHKINDEWQLAINGQQHIVNVEPEGCMSIDLDPFTVAVWFNGWLAGLFDPVHGGYFAAGSGANEAAFIEAVNGEGGNKVEP